MRFIGPRPEVEHFFDKRSFVFLKKTKPGLSDFSSIILRDESKILERIGGENPYSKLLPIKLELAQYYSNKKSFSLDLFLVIITIFSIFFNRISIKILMITMLSKDLPHISEFVNEVLPD